MSGPVENEISPIRTFFGTLPAKSDIACAAASSRVGFTSFARIEPETSTSSTTVARSDVSCTVARGRATAVAANASASRKSASGTSDRHLRRRSTTDASSSRFVNATA